ncbi:MAG TPA: hypothetical protein VFN95_05955 [Flavitalea sp.]|nr:hypothetical protein [Flavitalea sp.]
MRKLHASVTLIFCASIIHAQSTENKTWLLREKLPEWSATALKSLKVESSYTLSDFINPYYLEADFNGDNKIDIAIAVEQVRTKKKGFVIIHQPGKNYFVVGAGNEFGNGGDDFTWMDIWKVYTDKTIGSGVGEKNPAPLKAKAILVAKSESSSAVIYWTGNKYQWYHQGD